MSFGKATLEASSQVIGNKLGSDCCRTEEGEVEIKVDSSCDSGFKTDADSLSELKLFEVLFDEH